MGIKGQTNRKWWQGASLKYFLSDIQAVGVAVHLMWFRYNIFNITVETLYISKVLRVQECTTLSIRAALLLLNRLQQFSSLLVADLCNDMNIFYIPSVLVEGCYLLRSNCKYGASRRMGWPYILLSYNFLDHLFYSFLTWDNLFSDSFSVITGILNAHWYSLGNVFMD